MICAIHPTRVDLPASAFYVRSGRRSYICIECHTRGMRERRRRARAASTLHAGSLVLDPLTIPRANALLRAVCATYRVPPHTLRHPGPGRHAAGMAEARQVFCYLMVARLRLQYTAIGLYLGCNRRSAEQAATMAAANIALDKRSTVHIQRTIREIVAELAKGDAALMRAAS